MSTIELEPVVEQSPEAKELMVVANEVGIELEAAQSLLDRFAPMAKKARELVLQSANIKDPKLARTCRLGLREVRIDVENTRKKAKEDSLRRGKAVDGMANILKAIIEPAEQRMSDCEHAAEIAEQKRKDELKASRELQLQPFGIDVSFYNLGDMPDETFTQLLDNTKAAHQAKIDAARKADEERIRLENGRLKEEARIREENEKLKREAAEREAALKKEREAAEAAARVAAEKAAKERAEIEAKAKAEREAIEAKARAEREAAEAQARKEREAREKIEAENRARIAAEQAKAEAEAKAKTAAERAPDKLKLASVVAAFRGIQLPQMATVQGKAASAKISRAFDAFIATVEAECKSL